MQAACNVASGDKKTALQKYKQTFDNAISEEDRKTALYNFMHMAQQYQSAALTNIFTLFRASNGDTKSIKCFIANLTNDNAKSFARAAWCENRGFPPCATTALGRLLKINMATGTSSNRTPH